MLQYYVENVLFLEREGGGYIYFEINIFKAHMGYEGIQKC